MNRFSNKYKNQFVSLVNCILNLMGFRLVFSQSGYIIERNVFFDELRVIDYFFKNLESPVIFDVGAHHGQSIRYYKKKFPNGLIHSFEPVPDNFAVLKKNFDSIGEVSLNNVGVSHESGEMQINLYGDGCTGNSFLGSNKGSVQEVVNVPVTSIDEYIEEKNLTKINILKLDTQGFELECLKGARKALQEGRIDFIKTEVMLHNYYDRETTISSLEVYLSQFDYSLYDICSIKKSSKEARTLLLDLVFVSKSLMDSVS